MFNGMGAADRFWAEDPLPHDGPMVPVKKPAPHVAPLRNVGDESTLPLAGLAAGAPPPLRVAMKRVNRGR